MRNSLGFTKRKPQYVQTSQQPGVMVGHVVSARDPWRKGRAKVQLPGKDGDYPLTDIGALEFIQSMQPGRGAFMPPQLGDRVLVSFQAGEKNSPMIIGHVQETPMGDGKTFWNSRTGSEVHPKGWFNRALYPEALVLAASGLGNVISMRDVVMDAAKSGTGDLASCIEVQDTGGKFFRINSFHEQVKTYVPVDVIPDGKGTLYQQDYGKTEALTKGTETLTDIDQVAGSIDLGMHLVQKTAKQAKEEDSLDRTLQLTDKSTVSHSRSAVSGKMYSICQEESAVSLMEKQSFLAGQFYFSTRPLMPPEKW